MQARDVMVSPVITVRKASTVRDVAKILLEKRISAVPVVDNAGKVAGIVTEGDLMHRVEAGTERHYSWWAYFLSGDAALATDYVKSHAKKVEDVMTCDVITAAPETPLHEIAMLLEKHQIKRVPIVDKAGDLVGIVSRSNIIQALASARPTLEITLSDSTIRQKLIDQLKSQSWTHGHKLGVTVTNGVVDLWGTVRSDSERRAVRVTAEAIPGVTAVNDHLMESNALVY